MDNLELMTGLVTQDHIGLSLDPASIQCREGLTPAGPKKPSRTTLCNMSFGKICQLFRSTHRVHTLHAIFTCWVCFCNLSTVPFPSGKVEWS